MPSQFISFNNQNSCENTYVITLIVVLNMPSWEPNYINIVEDIQKGNRKK